jgi:hypothetical protein
MWQFNPDTCFWTHDGVSMEEDPVSPLSDHSLLSTMELKNPFEYMVAADCNPTFDQDPENVSRLIPLTTMDDADSALDEIDMSQYLHFDY